MSDAPTNSDLCRWLRVEKRLEASFPASTYELWFLPLALRSASTATVVVSGPRQVVSWVKRRYAEHLELAVRAEFGADRHVELAEADPADANDSLHPAGIRELPLNPGQTFESLVIGRGNRVAHAAALAVAEMPGEAYNPLFVYGAPGVGKTHLLNSVAHYVRRHHPALRLHLTTAERFTSEFVGSVRGSTGNDFKGRYRNLDVLLIDDVQILEGKQRTEEEFLHTFNALHAAGKQIVLTSDRPAAAMPGLAERLRDRFNWGLTVEIDPPDLRTRLALLWRMKSQQAPELVDPLVLREIASRSGDNARLLEGSITRVIALASILSVPISHDLVRRALPDNEVPEPAASARIDPETVRDAVCDHFDLHPSQLASRNRSAVVSAARQLAMYLCRESAGMSPAQIARFFDRDQSTVAHALRKIGTKLEPGSSLAGDLQSLRITLGTTPARPGDTDSTTDG